jgi:hypothetical protein
MSTQTDDGWQTWRPTRLLERFALDLEHLWRELDLLAIDLNQCRAASKVS